MPNAIRTFLATTEPFNKLPASELDHLASVAREVTHDKGETIYSEGEEAESVWILKTGRLEIFKYSSDGKPTAIESLGPKSLYGTYCRIGNAPCGYPCTAVAAMASSSICIPDKMFWALFERNPAFVMGMCALCSQHLNGMQNRVITSQEPVHKRIVQTLVDLTNQNGPTLSFTKREIADLSFTTVETTIRTLSAFEKKHWISSERGQITLRDKPRLEALLN